MFFKVMDVEAKYYADGEDAYAMKRSLEKFRRQPADVKALTDGADDAATKS